MEPPPPSDRRATLDKLVDNLVDSYAQEARTQHLDATFLPSREQTIEIIELLRKLIFPGFFDDHRLTTDNVKFHVGELLSKTHDLLYEQIRQSLRHEINRIHGDGRGDDCDAADKRAAEVTVQFIERLPAIRHMLALDVQATYDGDPAADDTDETIFCYPGIDAIFTHRVAHELWNLDVPFLPRIMTEYAHNETGIDIHPGAKIGERFCIDHGTGIVIGETTEIGNNVNIYQGVTLGALSLKGGHDHWKGRKRHPTIEDDVTIYGGAIILGGNTTIGKGAVIGGSVFITHSIPAGHTVTMKYGDVEIKPPRERKKRKVGEPSDA